MTSQTQSAEEEVFLDEEECCPYIPPFLLLHKVYGIYQEAVPTPILLLSFLCPSQQATPNFYQVSYQFVQTEIEPPVYVFGSAYLVDADVFVNATFNNGGIMDILFQNDTYEQGTAKLQLPTLFGTFSITLVS